MKTDFNRENFTLVLSGGGALGIAHLGVLHDLEELNIIPKEIIGTSMGGIIGACIAIGMKEKEIHKEIEKFSNAFNWIKFSFSGNAVIDNGKIAIIFDTLFKNKKMKDTIIPLKLIATNLHNGHKRVFTASDDTPASHKYLNSFVLIGTLPVILLLKMPLISYVVFGFSARSLK